MNNMIGIPSILKIFTFALFEKSSRTFLIISYTDIPLYVVLTTKTILRYLVYGSIHVNALIRLVMQG